MEGFTFSIREYASRMRSIDVVKCWPFDETSNEETVKSLLPPITFKKFSYWLDELQNLPTKSAHHQNLNNEKKKKVETPLRNEDIKLKSLKGKGNIKAPKKRSIVEIFAVAPQIERVISSTSDDDEEEKGFNFNSHQKGVNWGVKGKRNEKKMKSKDVILSKLKKAKQVIKKTNKLCQGKHSKLKAQSQDKAIERLNSSSHRRKMTRKASELITENENPALPGNDILKNHAKELSMEQSTECILQETVTVNHLDKLKAAEDVTFSKNDDILSLRRKPSPSAECSNLQKSCRLNMGAVDHEWGVGKDSTDVETSGVEDISDRVENETGTFSRSVMSDRSKRQSINEEMFGSILREAPLDPMYACPPEEYYNSPGIRVIRNSVSSIFSPPDPRLTPVCFKDYLENNNGPSSSYLSNLEKVANKTPQASSRSDPMTDLHMSHYQTFPYRFPKEVPPTFYSELNQIPTGHVLRQRVLTGIDKGFVGLPLNSHGELIALNSSAKGDFDQMMKSSVTVAPSTSLSVPRNSLSKGFGNPSEFGSLDCRTFSKDQLKSFPVETYEKENPVFVFPSTLDTTESQSSGVTSLDLDLIKSDDHSVHSQKEDKRVQTSQGTDRIQSTMRLMGKEFIVGGKSFQGIEDANTWKDKHIFDELQCQSKSCSNILIHDWNEPSLGTLGETLFCPSKTAINHGPESRCIVPHFGHETSLMHRNGVLSRQMNQVQKLYPSFSPGTFPAVCNSDSLLLKPSRSGHNFYSDLRPNVNSSAIQMKSRKNLPRAPRSAFRFPFMHPDLESHVQSTCNQASSMSQSPLFFDVPEKKIAMTDSQLYRNIGSNHWTETPVSHKPEVFYLHDPFFSGSTLQSSVTPASLAQIPLTQHALMPVYPGVAPIPSVQKTHANPTIRGRIKSNIGTRGPHHGKKAKRQLSAVSNVPFKPFKVPSLGSQESSQSPTTKPTVRVNFEVGVQDNEKAFESCTVTDTSKTMIWEEQRVSPWMDSDDDIARSGPTKLLAGAKHVLKACQHIDQSSSTSTYPDILLGGSGTTKNIRFLEAENSKKIYRF